MTCFTMLHHVPSAQARDELFCEVNRVLPVGGMFVGTDSTDTPELRGLHVDDTFATIDPETLPTRLEAAGFTGVDVTTAAARVRLVATRLS